MTAMQTVDLRIDAPWIVPVEPAGVLAGHAILVDGGAIVAIVPVGRRRRVLRGARDARAGLARADSRPRQRAHARGDDADARHRRRRAAEAVARAAHLAVRRPLRVAGVRLRRHAARQRRDAAGRRHVLQRHVLLSGRRGARLRGRRHARAGRHAGPRLPDAVRGRCGRLPGEGTRRARRVQARGRSSRSRSRRTRRTR